MQVLVLGMHRSGTSALGRLLNMMGCYFGEESVMARAAQDNPKGFWERLDVVWANDELLRLAGGSWWEVDRLDFAAAAPEPATQVQRYLGQILLKLDAHRPWFVKDPRLCLTLDHWLPHLERPVFIHAQRSPLQVARSLQRRNAIPLEYGLALWEFYTRSLLLALGGLPRIPFRYEDLLRNPHQTVARLHAALAEAGVDGLRLPSPDEVEAFITPSLGHGEDATEPTLRQEQQDLLAALEQNAPAAPDPVRMEALRQRLEALRTGSPWAGDLARGSVAMPPPEQLNGWLRERNVALEARVLALETSLQRLLHSRLVLGCAGLARLMGRTGRGLVPELRHAASLLAPDQATAQAAPGLVRRILHNPSGLVRILHPRRLKNGLLLLASGREGLRQVRERCRMHLGLPRASGLGNPLRAALPLIDRYGLSLPRPGSLPAPATDAEVDLWTRELRLLANNLARQGDECAATIIIPVHNQIRFTLACLHSIYLHAGRQDYEVLIADDASTDQTRTAFSGHFPRVRHLRSDVNLGFLRTCNAAAQEAKGRFLVFLNNDTVVLPGWLSELLRTFADHPGTGLAGSKLIYPDGRLQEAGGFVFEDGGAWNYGRLQDPADQRFNFARDTDYCSGASLAVDAALWKSLGGFDERFAPAYYEDTDLAFRVRAAGRRVLYQPCSSVVHFEGLSSGTSENTGVKRHQALNRTRFKAKWADGLAGYGPCDPASLPVFRGVQKRILVVDAATPTPDKDSGSVDTCNLMRIFQDLGFQVTFLPANCRHGGRYTEDLQRAGIQCIHEPWTPSVRHGIRRFAPGADIVLLSRVGVAAPLLPLVRQCAPKAAIWFDTVDLHFLRENREAALRQSFWLARRANATRRRELDVVRNADMIILRSEYEVDVLRTLQPEARLLHVPIMRAIPGPGPTPWHKRKDIVFLGGYAHPPNIDAVRYFAAEVMPLLRKAGFPGRFVIAGSDLPAELAALAAPDIEARGFVPDLAPLFDACRLTVAPLRYGAGMKGKVISSLAHGVPCVATPVAVEGSALEHGRHLLVAATPEETAQAIMAVYHDQDLWLRLSAEGLRLCRDRYSMDAASQIIAGALEGTGAASR